MSAELTAPDDGPSPPFVSEPASAPVPPLPPPASPPLRPSPLAPPAELAPPTELAPPESTLPKSAPADDDVAPLPPMIVGPDPDPALSLLATPYEPISRLPHAESARSPSGTKAHRVRTAPSCRR